MSYYLLDHPNPNGQHFRQRRGNPRIIVLHTAENNPDWEGPDTGAELIARYFSRTERAVSIHSCVDSDSIIPCLPHNYTAYHVRGYNSISLGIEICTQARKWDGAPTEWKQRIIENAATVVRGWCDAHGIARRYLTKAQVDGGYSGIVTHAELDPSRRSDPGRAFPYDAFLGLVNGVPLAPVSEDACHDTPQRPVIRRGARGSLVTEAQQLLVKHRHDLSQEGGVDGIFGPGMEREVKAFQAARGLAADGIIGSKTWHLLFSNP